MNDVSEAIEIIASTPTGGNKNAIHINFGKDGLVGQMHQNLIVEFDFNKTVKFIGTKTDYYKHPYTIKIGDNLDQLVATALGSHTFPQKLISHRFQVEWKKTDGTEGIHFEFVECEKSVNTQGWFFRFYSIL